MISLLISILIWLLVFCVVVYVIKLVLDALPLPPNVRQIALAILGLIGAAHPHRPLLAACEVT